MLLADETVLVVIGPLLTRPRHDLFCNEEEALWRRNVETKQRVARRTIGHPQTMIGGKGLDNAWTGTNWL